MIHLDVAPIPNRSISVERALEIGLLPVSKQQLLDPNEYQIEAKPVTATIEGEQ